MPLAEFEPAIPVSERPQTHTLDRAVTDMGKYYIYPTHIYEAQSNNTLFIARQCLYHKATEAPDRPMALDNRRRPFGRSDRENTSQFLHLKVVTC